MNRNGETGQPDDERTLPRRPQRPATRNLPTPSARPPRRPGTSDPGEYAPTQPRRETTAAPAPAPSARKAGAFTRPQIPQEAPTHAGSQSGALGRSALGRYSIVDELGRGGLGVVHLAHDETLERHVAIKVLRHATDEQARAEFVREAKVTGQLEHPNIVPVHELAHDEANRPLIVMKRIQGATLQEIIDERRERLAGASLAELQSERLLDIYGKVLDALAYAHSIGVVHRDLKPENIMVGEFGEVLVMDWGIAKRIGDETQPQQARQGSLAGLVSDDTALQATLEGEVFGTPSYMAPEQAEGRVEEIDERSDIFALGGILYALLTYEPPYKGRDVQAVLKQATRARVMPPRKRAPRAQISRELEAIVLKAMHRERRYRYPDVAALRADLDAWISHRPIAAARARWHERLVKWTRRHPQTAITAGMGAIFVLVLGVLASVWFAERAESRARQAAMEVEQAQLAEAAARANQERLEEEQLRLKEAARRQEAEQAQREAELQAIAQRGEIRELLTRLDSEFGEERDAALDEFREQWRTLYYRYGSAQEVLRHLDDTTVERAFAALHALLDAETRYGSEVVTVGVEDLYQLAFMYAAGRGEYQRALSYVQRALRIDPDHLGSLHLAGTLLRTVGRPQEALDTLNRAIELHQDSAVLYYERADTLRDLMMYEEAERDLTRAIELQPDYANAYGMRSFLYFIMHDQQRAVRDANRALVLDPQESSALLTQAMIEVGRGNARAAMDMLTRAIEATPENPLLYVYRSIAFRMARDFEGAIADCDRALEINPRLWNAYFQRGVALFESGNRLEAIEEFTQALEYAVQSGQRAQLYEWRGRSKRLVGDLPGAYADYHLSLRINERNSPLHLELALVNRDIGSDEAALESLRKAYRYADSPRSRAQIEQFIRDVEERLAEQQDE